MSRKTFFIVLNNCPTNGYIPGSSATGQVLIYNERVQKIKGITIALVGEAHVSFTIRRIKRRRNVIKRVTETEVVLRSVVDLFSLNEARTAKLQPGWHVYRFEFRLPEGIPSSFAGSHGFIQYQFSATMKRSFNINKTAKLPILVSDHLDLNNIARAKVPIAAQMQKHFSCLRCTGPIEILIQVLQTGFAMGENVVMSIDIDNQSSSRVRKTKIFITQEITFHTRKGTKTKEQRQCLSKVRPIRCGEHEAFLVDLKIPQLRSTDLPGNSRIITVTHFFEIRLQFSIWESDFARRIPIIIGTVPLRDDHPVQNWGFQNQADNYYSMGTTVPTCPTIVEPENISDRPSPYNYPSTPSPISALSVEQDFDNGSICSGVSLPPAYANFEDLPPSYADAIKLQL